MENNIKEKKKLYSVAKDRSEAGEPDLYSFMMSKNPKPVSDPIMTTWEIENAAAEIEQQNRTRIDVVINCAQQACVDSCNGVWVKRTLQVLRNNSTAFQALLETAFDMEGKKAIMFFFSVLHILLSLSSWNQCSSVL